MPRDVHADFLRLTGFDESEIAEFMPDWRVACERLGLTDEDVRFSTDEWLPSNFEVSLLSVRKLLGCFVRETVDLAKAVDYKAKGVKVVYGILPAMSVFYYALKLAAPDKVYVGFPDLFLAVVLQSFFHKLNPLLHDAEEGGITYGCRHCALNKTRFSARRKGIIPSPDISWIWGLVCDEGPKTDEFIQCHQFPDWKTYVLRIPRDQPLGTHEDEVDERVRYLAAHMKDGFEYVQKQIGVNVPASRLKEVVAFRQSYFAKLGQFRRLMAADPQPYGGAEAYLLSYPLQVPINTGVERMEQALELAIREVEERVARKEGILPAGSPKLMFQITPYCQPWIIKLFKDNGVLLSAGGPTKKGLSPLRYDDPYLQSAEIWLRGATVVNIGYQAEQVCEQLLTYNFDGMLFGFFDFDRWLGSDDRLLATIVEERTGLPTFYVEGDFWEDRDYSQEGLRTRVESICEILKMRKFG
ncbi:MAG: 2-hydroxyacyl-CoA dehydratase family protein [Dehalococcoidia bacterium]|nr:2-hydroxyacyl-CoA dehydratase family protein [Dehalococcoidia bacterium]